MPRHGADSPSLQAVLDERTARWRIGLIALATDHTSERDFVRFRPDPEMALYVNRVAFTNPTNAANLRRMQPLLSDAAALILPDEPLDVIAYSCTSASVAIGDAEVRAAVQAGKPGVPCVTPVTGALAGFAALSLKRISVLAPYIAEVSAALGRYFTDHGIEVVSLRCFGLEDDRAIARVSLESIVEAAVETCDPAAEGLFVSCTALRAASVLEEIERRIGRPVITSTQAMFWQCFRTAGYDRPIDGHGRLFRC